MGRIRGLLQGSDLVRLALRLIVEEALEGEVADALGRERYERGEGEKTAVATGPLNMISSGDAACAPAVHAAANAQASAMVLIILIAMLVSNSTVSVSCFWART